MNNNDKLLFNKDLFETLIDVGSFRAFCDLKRNHSSLLYGKFVSNQDKFKIPRMEVSAPEFEESKEELSEDSNLEKDRFLFKEQELDRLFSYSGVTYKFDRGLVMIDDTGKKVEDIFDDTYKHHATEIVNVARDEFNTEVPFLGMACELHEAIYASNNGLSTLLLEGNMAQLYLPAEVSNEMLDEIKQEIEVRDDFIFYIVRDNMATDELLKDEVLDYIDSLYVLDSDIENKEEKNISNVDEYIKNLILYTLENRISVYDYYYSLGEKYRNNEIDLIEEFEKRNPFLTADDILKLIESNDNDILNYFAESMNRVIELNYKGDDYLEENVLKDINNSINEDEEIGQITSINLDLLYSAKGFVLVNEKSASTLSVYAYDPENPDEVKGKTTYNNVPDFIESGFYVNFMEFENNFRKQYNNRVLSFITVDGEELDYDIVMEAALDLSRRSGAIRLGKEYKEKDINSVSDLEDLYTGEEANYKGNIMTKGMYVSRDILYDFFSRLEVKVKKKEEETILDNTGDIDLEAGFQYTR